MDYKKIGNHIRSARRHRKLTQEEVAEMADISVSYLGHLERGTRKASLETLFKLCTVLALSMDTVTDIPPSDSDETLAFYIANQMAECIADSIQAFLQQYAAEEKMS